MRQAIKVDEKLSKIRIIMSQREITLSLSLFVEKNPLPFITSV